MWKKSAEGRPVKGPWPAPSADRVEPVAVEYADRFPAWAHRKVAMLMRVDGHHAPDSTVLRALKRTGRVLPVGLPGRACQHAKARRAAVRGGAVGSESSLAARLHRVRDPPRRAPGGSAVSPATTRSSSSAGMFSTTASHRDAIETLEQAIDETDRLTGRPLRELLVDPVSGEIRPIALVTDNGPCFKAARFAAYIEKRPELIHIRTRRNSPNQNGVRERALRLLEIRAPLQTRDRQRLRPRTRGRDLPPALQPDPPARRHRHPPPTRRPPRGDQQPSDHQAIRARNPATFVKRDRVVLMVVGGQAWLLRGRWMVMVVPCPGPLLVAVVVPLCASMMDRVMASPRPVPAVPWLRDWVGSVGAVEDVGEVLGVDADPVVGDRDR